MKKRILVLALPFALAVPVVWWAAANADTTPSLTRTTPERLTAALISQGRQTFRYDTFGDEAFWTAQLRMQEVVENLSPRRALALGLKVDADALPAATINAIKSGAVDLDDPAVTVELVDAKAVVGVIGKQAATAGQLRSIGFACALCHSTVDDSVAPGIGRRLDGLANRDLNVGAIIAAAPNLTPIVNLLKLADRTMTADKVRTVLRSWGPGKYDAELILDGKAFQPNGRSAATMIPDALDLAGYNLHTWTGGWGSIPYWNAFVAVLQMHGRGSFLDERLDNAAQYPIAAAARLGHIEVDADEDRVTSKLPALQVYQLSLAPFRPREGIDFNGDAADRGDELFEGKAKCASCHLEPLWTEGGWNQHTPEEMRIDAFEANRSPSHAYKTMNLSDLFIRERGLFMQPSHKGRFYHDGRFKTLLDVVNSYNRRFSLGLTDAEKRDLVEYLKSL